AAASAPDWWRSSRRAARTLDQLHLARIGLAHLQALARDPLDARVRRPGARLELQLAVLDLERARALLLALELGEELARLVLRSHQAERAGDQHREKDQRDAQHRPAPVSRASRPCAAPRCARADWREPRPPPAGSACR